MAAYKAVKRVEAVINADSLGYISIEGLVRGICKADRDSHGRPMSGVLDRGLSC